MSDYPPPPPPAGDEQQPSPYGAGSPPPPPPGGESWPPPPPPPPGGYGAPPAGAGGYSAGDAISYGWAKFKAAPGPLLIAALIVGVGTTVFQFIADSFSSAVFDVPGMFDGFGDNQLTASDAGFVAASMATLTTNLIVQVVVTLLGAALVKGALSYADGNPIGFGDMFNGWDKLQVLVASLLVAVGTMIGLVLCIIPGLVFMFLTLFTTVFVVDRDMPAIDAIKASINLTKNNVGNVLLFALLSLLVIIAGAIACLVGLLVAYPVVLIGAAYTYRVLQGQPVSPAA